MAWPDDLFRHVGDPLTMARLCSDWEARLPYLRQHGGHAMAYSTLQECTKAFIVPEIGYIAYAYAGGRAFVLADPIAPQGEWRRLTELFLKEHPRAVFMQIGEEMARICAALGFYVNHFGTETDIDVPSFKMSWSKRKTVNCMYGIAKRSEIRILNSGSEAVGKKRLEQISDESIAEKVSSRKELSFLARPVIFEDEPDVRKFYEFLGDELIGFVFFSPMYRDEKIVGYLWDIHRHIREAPSEKDKRPRRGTEIKELCDKGIAGAPVGITYFTIVEAIKEFQREGIATLSLGLSPFHGVDDQGGIHSPFTRWLFRTIYTRLDWLYHNTGNYLFKSRWRGTEKKVYFATRERYPLKTIFYLYRLCNVF